MDFSPDSSVGSGVGQGDGEARGGGAEMAQLTDILACSTGKASSKKKN